MGVTQLPQPIQVRVEWQGLESLPVLATNAVLIQQTPHEFVITFGFVEQPIFHTPPTPEQLASLKTIPGKAIFRVSMPPGRIVELIGQLNQQIQMYQQSQKH